ncbi:MAG: hypothetical protein ACR2LE_05985, partial [Nocardioidaceae bacterium]
SIRSSGPRRLLGARSYFWTSTFHADASAGCGDDDGVQITCQDSVPQRGWIRWDRLAWPRARRIRTSVLTHPLGD